MKNVLILACLCLALVSAASAQEAQPDTTLFLQANQAYKSADYAAAAAQYEQLLASGLRNGELLYNLGNACLKKGDIGRALFNYRLAERFLPRDADLEANLQYALEQTKDRIDCGDGASFRRTFFFWYYKLSLPELCYGFVGFNFLLWILLGCRFFLRSDSLGLSIAAVLFFTALFGGSFAVKYWQIAFNTSAVVLAQEVQVRSGSSLNDTIVFKLHEGAELRVNGQESEWVKISLCDGKKGWVQKSSIAIVPGV